MSFCQPCRNWVGRHPKATRWVAFFVGLSVFFSILGWMSDPVTFPGMCRIYP